MSEGPIHVVAGILRDAQARVLLAQRPAGKHLAGLWEFPGGKCEPGEPPEHALRRELHEEIGVEIGVASSCTVQRHLDALERKGFIVSEEVQVERDPLRKWPQWRRRVACGLDPVPQAAALKVREEKVILRTKENN